MSGAVESPTRFAWACLGRPAYPPPLPQRGPRFGPDAACWLCAGPTEAEGWPVEAAVPFKTFTNHNLARVPVSTTLCQPCAYFARKDAWDSYLATRPDSGLKTGKTASWRWYGHVFAAGCHDCPTRTGWRTWLLDPPAPPFLFIVSATGQKHLIFRGQVARDRDLYPIQFEEDRVWVRRGDFAACLAAFEALYAAGFSKDSILTGQYHPAQLIKVGAGTWRGLEDAFAPWRTRAPGLVRLAHYCATRPEESEDNG